MTCKLLIIGLDGATFDLIEPWAAAGDDSSAPLNSEKGSAGLPNLARLMRAEGREDVTELSCSGFGKAIIERM